MWKTNVLYGLGICLAAAPACAQLPPPPAAVLPPETALLGHQVGAPGTDYVEELAAGRDHNPARLLEVQAPSASVKIGHASNRGAPDLLVKYGQFTPRGGDRWRAQLIYVRADGDDNSTPGATLDYREQDFSAQFAYKLNPRLSLGAAVSYLSTEADADVTALGNFHLSSRPDRLLAGRVGAIYRATSKLDLEAIYDNYAEETRLRAPALYGPNFLQTNIFESRKYVLGAVYHLRRADLLVSHHIVRVSGDSGFLLDREYSALGVKVPLGKWQAQASLYDGFGNFGIGYRSGATKINVALLNRYKALLPQAQSAYYFEAQRFF